jgi:hypothetical protein
MKSLEEIESLYLDRERAAAPWRTKAIEVRDTYEGVTAVPLPELSKEESVAVANLIQQGTDQLGMRVSSVMPEIIFEAQTGVGRSSKDADNRAKTKRLAVMGWWQKNRMNVKLRRRARWLIAYGCSPVVLRPSENGIPRWDLRDPLTTFPAPGLDPDDVRPPDCIFAFKRSLAWLKYNHPEAANMLNKGLDPTRDTEFTVLEYVDHNELVLMALGRSKNDNYTTVTQGVPRVELLRIPNRAYLCPAIIAGRITLDRLMSQFETSLGMYREQARLWALHRNALERGIFKETWLVGRQNENPQIITQPDPRQGVVGEVKGGIIQEISVDPGFQTPVGIDRLERAQRLSSGIPAEFGGESGSNIRTGRRGENVLSAVVDFPVQEYQQLFELCLEEENKTAIAIAKAYNGSQPKSFYVGLKGAKGRVEYTPNDTFDSDEHKVSYSYAGADTNGLVIEGLQRVGAGTLSKKTWMNIDPFIDDPNAEMDQVTYEALNQALLSSIQTQAADPMSPIPIVDLAWMMNEVKTGKSDLPEAVEAMQKRAQKRQAEQAPPGSPETMPGASLPGMGTGAEAGAAIQETPPSMQNLVSLMAQTRMPQMTVPAER